MRRQERLDDPEDVLRVAMHGNQAKLWTAMPGIVESFDADKMTCVVQPAIKGVFSMSDGSTYEVTMPLLLDCPVHFVGGGGFSLTFPVTSGDECLVVFASRCIDAWWQSGGVQSQAELRMHDLSDGFAIVGFHSQPRAFGVSTANVQLVADGDVVMDIPPSGPIVFSRPIIAPMVTGTTDVLGGGKSLKDHMHTGVTPGGGITGPPQ